MMLPQRRGQHDWGTVCDIVNGLSVTDVNYPGVYIEFLQTGQQFTAPITSTYQPHVHLKNSSTLLIT
jgi:hypothetical protein